MDLRRLVRGSIPWADLEAVGNELRARNEREYIRMTFLEADNWLSTPCVVDDTWFVKIISPQNAVVHALFTGARNLGAVVSGENGFFGSFDDPYEMAQHELDATYTLREVGVNVPKPVEAFDVDEYGVLVLEYLPEFETLSEQDTASLRRWSPQLFESLWLMHDNGLVHGDLRGENVLVYRDELYFIDVTNVRSDGLEGAKAYDLASALATLAPHVGTSQAVADALTYYSVEDLMAAREFMDFVRLRPDHDFDAARVKGEIEKRASRT